MPKYILTYHQPAGYVPGVDPEAMAAWEGYFETIGSNVVDPGQPVFERTTIGEVGTSTQLAGFSIVSADDLNSAAGLASACPTLGQGGGVQVGLLAELPPEHAASRLRDRASRA